MEDKSLIIINNDVLSPHYIPDEIKFREAQMKGLESVLSPFIKNQKSRNIIIYGKTGTGKTCIVKNILKKMGKIKGKYIYLNCRIYNTRYRVIQKIVKSMMEGFDKSGFGLPTLYEKIVEWMSDNRQLLVVLDEIDMVKDVDELIYTLTRSNDDTEAGGLTLIGISNRLLFKNQLDPRSKSSLHEKEMVFPPYSAIQLKKILEQRAELAFKKGSIELSALSLAGAIAARESGDARYALKLLTQAAEIAEEEKTGKITDKEVKKAVEIVDVNIIKEALTTLPENYLIVLYAIARLTLSNQKYVKLDGSEGSRYLFSGEIYEEYCSLSNKVGKTPRTSRWFREYLNDLEMLGFIISTESGRGIKGRARLIMLTSPPHEIIKDLKKIFNR
ncbi:AAA family ATPase [Candidatus Micrarchaeota archaeon]|nr:AAA family ATPase [Candidatus Micrarchaeota archaeon]